MKTSENVILKVSVHPSGRHTLTRQDPGERMPKDLDGPLFANDDQVEFYRAVARYIADAAAAGEAIVYRDVS